MLMGKTIDCVLKISPFTDCNKTHFCCKFVIHSLDTSCLTDLNDVRDSKWHVKCPRNFQPPPLILPKIFIFYTVLMYTFIIPSSKQKHTIGSLTNTHTHTHTHTTINNYKQKATGHVTSLAKSNWARYFSC